MLNSKIIHITTFHKYAPIASLNLLIAALYFLFSGFHEVFYNMPADQVQGHYVKIMYIHVPSAWLSLFYYVVLAAMSASFYITLNPLFDILAKAVSYMGAFICSMTLITGSIWGKPTWGTYWVWDARLTSTAILLLIYCSYIVLRSSFYNSEKGAKIASLFAIIGLVNIPIIKFSVDLWTTLHQPSSMVWKGSASTMHHAMRIPLLQVAAGFLCFTAMLIIILALSEIYRRKIIRFNQYSNALK